MRGRLVSRPIGEVLREAEQLVRAGVKEILVISQDTSAYGVGPQVCRRDLAGNAERRARFYDLAAGPGRARRMDSAALRLSLSARRQGRRAHGRRARAALSRHSLPARERAHLEAHEAAGRGRRTRSSASPPGGGSFRTSRCAAPSSSAFPARPSRTSSELLEWLRDAQLDRVGCFEYSPVEGAAANALPESRLPDEVKQERRAALHGARGRDQRASGSRRRSAATCRCSSTDVEGGVAIARSASDAPEIDGVVRIASRWRPESRRFRPSPHRRARAPTISRRERPSSCVGFGYPISAISAEISCR